MLLSVGKNSTGPKRDRLICLLIQRMVVMVMSSVWGGVKSTLGAPLTWQHREEGWVLMPGALLVSTGHSPHREGVR